MRLYETTIVIDSLQKAEEMQNILTKIKNFIHNNGGEILYIDEWGKKRLAYEINRKQYGNYFQIFFKGPSTLPKLLEREYRLEESILRYLTLLSEADEAELKEKASAATAQDAPSTESPAETPKESVEASPKADEKEKVVADVEEGEAKE